MKKKIQEWNNLLNNSYLLRKNVLTDFWGNMLSIINYVLPVTTLSKSKASILILYWYMDTISHI